MTASVGNDQQSSYLVRQCQDCNPDKLPYVVRFVGETYTVYLCNSCMEDPIYEGRLDILRDRGVTAGQ